MENNTEVPQKFKIEIPYNKVTILLDAPEENKITYLKRHKYPYVHCSIFNTIAKVWSNLNSNRWMDKDNMADNTHNGILLSHEKEQNLDFVMTWMN